MIEINWNVFKLKHPNSTEAFETLCYFLFCRKYNLTEGIRTDFNQVGLETEPIKNSQDKYCGFQAKFFEKKVDYSQIKESVEKALDNYEKLNHIVIYINQSIKTSSKSAREIEKKCKHKGVTVEWFLPANFSVSLNQPNNMDLAEFYFGEANVLKMLSDSKSVRMNTLLQSKEYIELTLQNGDSTLSISEYGKQILKSEQRLHLFTGAAGSGKSVCMRKLFNIYSGFDQGTEEDKIKVIDSVGALCIFINLNNTSLDSLETMIKAYRSQYFAGYTSNNFIYLMDGLDEIPNDNITATLLFIEDLLEKENTKSIVISSRLASNNKLMLKSSFQNIKEYTLKDLTSEQIESYFLNKGNQDKTNRFHKLCKNNDNVLSNITDVLLLVLLWENIFKITGTNLLPELMDISVNTILKDIHHKKYLDSLNVPNPKDDAIININKELSFYLFENDKFCFTQKELIEIILKIYPKCDYYSSNQIVSYLSDTFFDIVVSDNIHSFSYRHRRFSEYFTLLCIAEKAQNDLGYLRKNNIIINYDLFDQMLLPYLQNKAIKEKDLSLSFKTNLLNVYAGKDENWIVDTSFYYWSDYIIYAVSSLPNNILQNVIEDKSLPLYKFFLDIPKRLLSILSNSDNPQADDYLKQFYAQFVLLIVLLHKSAKNQFLKPLLPLYKEIETLCMEKKYHFFSISNKKNYDILENIFYIKTVIYDNDVNELVEKVISNTCEVNIDKILNDDANPHIIYSVSLYKNLLFYHPEKCVETIKKMNLNQLSVWTLNISKSECLAIYIKDHSIQQALKEKLSIAIDTEGLSSVACISLKKYLGLALSEEELSIVKNYFSSIPFKEYNVFWKEQYDFVGFITAPFINSEVNINMDMYVTRYVNAYCNYIDLLNGICSLPKFINNTKSYIVENSHGSYQTRCLIGKALALCETDDSVLSGAIDHLSDFAFDNRLLTVLFIMKSLNNDRFNKTISSSQIIKLNNPQIYQDITYSSTSDVLFMLAFITSSHNEFSVYDLILKGFSNGVMRMNERKDTIGDYILLDGLETIIENHWYSAEQLLSYIDRIFIIAVTMDSNHIENDVHILIMRLLLKYDFNAAEYYYNKYCLLNDNYNEMHFLFAKELVHRGKSINCIENCMKNIKIDFDNYYQKIERGSFYYKISIYLKIAVCDYYSPDTKQNSFEKACEEINRMQGAGWERELEEEEYNIYTQICNKMHKEVDVCKKNHVKYSSNHDGTENHTYEILQDINNKDEFNKFVSKLFCEYKIDSFEINDLLIQKSLDLTGNISNILELFKKSHYPSYNNYSSNNRYFWMTVVSALKNVKSKAAIFDYLLRYGSGHDGLGELIKIYGYLGDKKICLQAFETLLNCVEFLLC